MRDMDSLPETTTTPQTPQDTAPEKSLDDPFQSNSASVESSKRSRESTPAGDAGDGPLAKRARSSRRHGKHWDVDGDIFVRIEDCWMRLRKSGLAKHSEWFRDVFAAIDEGRLVSNPKRPYDQGTIIISDVKSVQNCYHVPAAGVSSTNFGLFLTAIEDAISYCHNPPPFPVISGILRAATMLKCPKFRDWATRSIQDMWSPSLDALSTTANAYATEAVILGRELGISDILKRSLYELLRTPALGQNIPEFNTIQRPGAVTLIQPADILCLVRAREYLDVVWHAVTAFDAFSVTHEHDDSSACSPVGYATYKRLVHDTGLFLNYRLDVLCGLEMLKQIDWEKETAEEGGRGMCAICVLRLRESWQKDREQAWEKLDEIFRLRKGDFSW